MKKVILGFLLILLSGCSTIKYDYSSIKEDVFLDQYNSWSNRMLHTKFDQRNSFRSITLRVINKKYCDVQVTVECRFQPEDVMFGYRTVTVGARDDEVFMVRGIARGTPDSETITCKITGVK